MSSIFEEKIRVITMRTKRQEADGRQNRHGGPVLSRLLGPLWLPVLPALYSNWPSGGSWLQWNGRFTNEAENQLYLTAPSSSGITALRLPLLDSMVGARPFRRTASASLDTPGRKVRHWPGWQNSLVKTPDELYAKNQRDALSEALQAAAS